MNQPRLSRKEWLLTAMKLLIVVLVVWAVRRTLLDAWNQLGDRRWHLEPGWLAGAGALYLLGLLPAGLFWHRVLLALGQAAGLRETLHAYYVGHLGKYVPGKAMVVVIRAGLVRSRRVDAGVAAVSVFLETLTMMAVGACIAAAILAVGFRDQRLLFWGSLGLMLAAGLPTLPPVFRRLVRLTGVGQSDPITAQKLEKLGPKTLAAGWGAMTLVWVMLGLSLWATFRALGVCGAPLSGMLPTGPLDGVLGHLLRYTACVSLAMVAGFLSLIPGGLGVRDLLLVKLIVRLFQVPAAEAAVASGLLRLVWLVSELLISGILYISRLATSSSGSPDR